MATEWAGRAGIALAVFLGALAIGHVTASTSGGAEASPPTALTGAGSAFVVPAQLTGSPPLERALGERASAEGAEVARRAQAALNAARARARGSASRHATQTRTGAGVLESTRAVVPVETTVPPPAPAKHAAPRHSSSGGSGASFDSSG
jgi:hypothetical protein